MNNPEADIVGRAVTELGFVVSCFLFGDDGGNLANSGVFYTACLMYVMVINMHCPQKIFFDTRKQVQKLLQNMGKKRLECEGWMDWRREQLNRMQVKAGAITAAGKVKRDMGRGKKKTKTKMKGDISYHNSTFSRTDVLHSKI